MIRELLPATSLLALITAFSSPAFGQGAPRAPTAPPAGTAPAATAPQAPAASAGGPQDTLAGAAAEMFATTPGGITAEQVATRAAQTSYQAKAADETANAASARVDQAETAWLPRIGLLAQYQRLSEFTPPSFGSGSLVVTNAPAGTPNPPAIAGGAFAIPLVLDQFLTQLTVNIPISDYFLKISKSVTAATQQEEAARLDAVAARAKSFSDGKLAYYTWLRARGAVVVAVQTLAAAKAFEKDAQTQFTVGNASKADVLRAQTQVATADLSLERSKTAVIVAEEQVRIAMHAKEDEKLVPGDSLESNVAPPPPSLKPLLAEALAQRPELKSIEKNAESARKLAAVAKANRYPSVSGFGDVTYANPNPRRFPQTSDWFPTWAVGARVTWSPNDLLVGNTGGADAESRAAALSAQREAIRDGIELEVTQSFEAVREADTAILTTTRQLEAALEASRVARELFNNGRATGTTLVDADRALALSRFDHLNARVDARMARIRLDHAVGRDAKNVVTVPAAP